MGADISSGGCECIRLYTLAGSDGTCFSLVFHALVWRNAVLLAVSAIGSLANDVFRPEVVNCAQQTAAMSQYSKTLASSGSWPCCMLTTGLTRIEIMKIVSREIGVARGFLGDYSDRTHADFYPEYCDLEIDPNMIEGTTRERFIAIIGNQSPRDQAKIVRGVLDREMHEMADKDRFHRNLQMFRAG